MKLNELLALMDDDISITIHKPWGIDGDYLFASDIESDLLDYEVVRIETGIHNKTDIRICLTSNY